MEGSASGAAAGGGKEGTRWGLAAASRGRAWPWPAKPQAAAAQQHQECTDGSGSFGNGKHTVGLAPPRAWGGGRGAVGVLDGGAGGLQGKEQRRQWSSSLPQPWRARLRGRGKEWESKRGASARLGLYPNRTSDVASMQLTRRHVACSIPSRSARHRFPDCVQFGLKND